jgi:8-oxo-dGTP diphosphatase
VPSSARTLPIWHDAEVAMTDHNACSSAPRVRRVVLCFVLRADAEGGLDVLLGRKKRGFGTGKVVGLGGHLLPSETEVDAAVREVAEESGVLVQPHDLTPAGGIMFRFPARPEWSMHTTVFIARRWVGEPVETDEIAPTWYPVTDLPFELMWSDAAVWIPHVLAGNVIDGTVVYDGDNQAMQSHDVVRIGSAT